jgi:recombination protein RecA
MNKSDSIDTKKGKNIPEKSLKTQQNNELLLKTIEEIRKTFGQDSIMKMGDDFNLEVKSIPTGSLSLDAALGIGGIPEGRVMEIYGAESSGKTTFTLHLIGEAQKMGKVCVFIDAEHALDPSYAAALGVDLDSLLLCQPDNGEQALEIVDKFVKNGSAGLIVIDSVAALIPRAELAGDMGDSHMGLQARLMGQALRKITATKSSTSIVFINQLRSKMNTGGYGPSETTTGGNALKFFSSVRCSVKKIATIKAMKDNEEQIVGSRIEITVVKNKLNPPFKKAEIDIVYGEGFSKYGEIFDLGVKFGIINKSGSWYSYNDIKLGQGKDNAITLLKANNELCTNIKTLVCERLKNKKI